MMARTETPIRIALRAMIPKIFLLLLLSLSPSCGMIPQSHPKTATLPPEGLTLPLWRGDVVPFVHVRGAVPSEDYLVCIDTGTRDVALMPELARRLGAKARGTFPSISNDATGTRVWISTTWSLGEFSLDAARFTDFDVDVFDFSPSFRTRMPVLAILGLNLFRDCLLTIDFPARQLVLEKGELPPPDGRDILPCRLPPASDLEMQATVGGEKLWVKIDTGSASLILSEDIASRLRFERPPRIIGTLVGVHGKAVPISGGTLSGNISFGDETFARPTVHIGGRSGRVLIGSQFLAPFRITIDQKNERIRFTRSLVKAS
jgi:hypothetical protein